MKEQSPEMRMHSALTPKIQRLMFEFRGYFFQLMQHRQPAPILFCTYPHGLQHNNIDSGAHSDAQAF